MIRGLLIHIDYFSVIYLTSAKKGYLMILGDFDY